MQIEDKGEAKREKRETNNPKDIKISDLRVLVIGVTVTGTIILVVVITALLVSKQKDGNKEEGKIGIEKDRIEGRGKNQGNVRFFDNL